MDSRPKFEDEGSSSIGKSSISNSNSILFLNKCSSISRDPGLLCCSNMELFSDEDIAIEILSRLPICSLLAFKCTATKWYKLISDPSFLRIHHKSSYDIAGLFVQEGSSRPLSPLYFYPLAQNKCRLNLDFLPEKFVLVGSSNGIICCRTYIYLRGRVCLPDDYLYFTMDHVELVIYLCDPARKEWITVRPPQGLSFNDILVFGFASYPFGTSSNQAPSFKLVNVQCSRNDRINVGSRTDPKVYSFFIYSSDTRKWEASSAVCSFDSEIRDDMSTFLNGRLHWSTLDHHLLTFDVENESSKLIKLPCCKLGIDNSARFGESEGFLHYVCVFTLELQVWVLKDYDGPVWELKYCLDLHEFCLNNANLFRTRMLVGNYRAWSYYNEVLTLAIHDAVLSYDFKTKRVIQHSGRYMNLNFFCAVIPALVVQCHANLVSLDNFVRDGVESSPKQEGRSRGILPCKRAHES